MSVAAAVVLRPGDDSALGALVRSSSVPAGVAQRARLVLLAAEGLPKAGIARRVGVTRQTVISWRARYQAGGRRRWRIWPGRAARRCTTRSPWWWPRWSRRRRSWA